MIISASRRTDLPAFFSTWFFNRIKEGFVMVRNPYNRHQVSKITLSPQLVDCFVFWTKNPGNMIAKLEELRDYSYYFLYTLTPYDKDIETNLPSKKTLISTFITLSQKIGRNKVIWRYDPILFTDKIDQNYHFNKFEELAAKLSGHTSTCIFSFLDLYQKTIKNMQHIKIYQPTDNEKFELINGFSKIAQKYKIKLQTCAEKTDFSKLNIIQGSCINRNLISEIKGKTLIIPADKNQRKECNCCESIDIGAYNTCQNYCSYCYANYNKEIVEKNFHLHDPKSPLLIGKLSDTDIITERKIKIYSSDTQLKLF